MEIITLQLGATETKSFRKAGSYIEILSGSGAVALSLYGLNAGINNTIQQGLPGLFLQADFAAFDVTNQYGVAQTVQLLVCDANEVGGSRRQPGVVQVVDTSKARTQAGQSFEDYGFAASTAVAAAHVQVFNPAASGKRLVVQAMNIAFNVAGTINIGITQTQAPTLRGSLKSKLSGGAASSSQLRTDVSATVYFANASSARPMQASTPLDLKFSDPFVLLPGYGLHVYNDIGPVGTMFATFEVIEEAL